MLCQDLSVAGKMRGMEEGSGTRSSLLFEVGRLLDEVEELPQILLMENVPQVISKKNEAAFSKWKSSLEWKGYKNYIQILNAKDYGVAQSRKRCFMVSILGDKGYQFPKPIPLTKCMKDYLEDEVEDKYYIKSEKAKKLIDTLIIGGKILTGRQTIELSVEPKPIEQSWAIMARKDRGISCIAGQGNGVIEVTTCGT